MRLNCNIQGAKLANCVALGIFILFALSALVLASSSSESSTSSENNYVESDIEDKESYTSHTEVKRGEKENIGHGESDSPQTPPHHSIESSHTSSSIQNGIIDESISESTHEEDSEGEKQPQTEIFTSPTLETVSKTPDSTFKFPKTKERFIPLNKWKEEKLQYVAKTLGGHSSTPLRTSDAGNSDSIPSSHATASYPIENGENGDLTVEKGSLDHSQASEEISNQEKIIPDIKPETHHDTPGTEFKEEFNKFDTNNALTTEASQPKGSDMKEGDFSVQHTSPQDSSELDSSPPIESPLEISESSESSELEKVNDEQSDSKMHEKDTPSQPLTLSTSDPDMEISSGATMELDEKPIFAAISNFQEDLPELISTSSMGESLDSQNAYENPSSSSDGGISIEEETESEKRNNPIIANQTSKTSTNYSVGANPSSGSYNPSPSSVSSNPSIPGSSNTPAPGSSSNPPTSGTSSKPTQRRLRKNRINYASHDCGAKVLASNDEAVDASAVLLGSKDRYMLNPCSAPRQWIVIELCEEVGIDHIQVGNFEFFSSMIKEVQVLASNRYPTNSWALLGNFTLSNERELQSLDFGEESEIFPEWFKYIKIRILSHWGNEYYCPITEIQVHGLPYVEKLQQELRQNSQELHHIEKLLADPNGGGFDSSLSNSPHHSSHPIHPNNSNTSSPSSHQGSSSSSLHHPDSVMPMDQYLEQHKPKTTEYFNSLYNTLSNIAPHDSISIIKSKNNISHLNPPSSDSINSIDKDHDYDIVHAGVPTPPPRIGGDDELDELEEDDDHLNIESKGHATSRDLPISTKSQTVEPSTNQEDHAAFPSENTASAGKISPASAIPTMNLIQLIIQRVKALEISQSLASAYLGDVSSFYRDELAEIGDALAELDQRYYLLLQVMVNTSSTSQAINDAKFSTLSAELQSANEFKKEVFGSMRMYLVTSAVITLVICVMCSFLVVLLLKCLPNITHERLQSAANSKLFRSSSDIALDQLRRSSSASDMTMVTVKEEPLANFPLSAPSTPPIPSHLQDIKHQTNMTSQSCKDF